MHVKGWVKSSLVDFPGRIAASLFSGGCNFRCPNCHNADLVLYPNQLPDLAEDEIWTFLEQRRGVLDGVVLSGGEPTLQPDLSAFIARLRQLGFSVKLDTNGYLPDLLEKAIADRTLDYVAMDVKAPMNKYAEATGTEIDTARIVRSIDLLLGSEIEYEFRTTVVPGILDEDDIVHIGEQIDGAQSYYLQQFVPRNTLDPAMMDCPPYSPSRIKAMVELVRPYVESVRVRGI